MTPPKKLTDTDENEAVRTPGGGDSSEHMRAIARDESKRESRGAVLAHEADCPQARDIWTEINKMREANAARDKQMAEFLGAQKLTRWLVPVVTSVATSALAVFLLRSMIAGMPR